ncbi:methyltransferase [Elizabethkingia meningoseptica]|uniref:SAM-dependent methyltransferase n=1 Tax=Elizabethkingia meningoseptica TaxID=238 RepID=A0A1T3JRM9_ELIME|nr:MULTISPECIES: class I SAM-dependent methyltransferase [Elizabethkingia]AQX05355.1 methyltransferase [Elizabethkingia meningoseptica]AQX12918.1 methyltransferase [Elizabethkingia meningoseptica]AQX47398.1 methyltransferase [Elizabethkingia meningoseptica]EOR31192.1 methyltransferase [Elizabethkingia meningoseptica ATCC 13253 = NBRC 12535]KUY24338.1 methyltransferase [Elizabethkingia meningoseptica]
MKQNIYDNPRFFAAYKELRDSDKGLNELLEQPVMKGLLQEVSGKNILDIGCGLGHQISSLLTQNPHHITGIDISEKMIAEAGKRVNDPKVDFYCIAAEDYLPEHEQFDIVISSMSMHYVKEIQPLFTKIYQGLNQHGQFLFSIEHPVCTAAQKGWYETNNEKYWLLNKYGKEGKRHQNWFVDGVIKYHRKLSTLVNNLTTAGFVVRNIEEPTPDDELLMKRPDFIQHTERPPVVIFNCIKY